MTAPDRHPSGVHPTRGDAAALTRAGWTVVTLDASSRADAFVQLREQLDLPDWFGDNLDALLDALRERDKPTAVLWPTFERFVAEHPHAALGFRDVFEERAAEGDGFVAYLGGPRAAVSMADEQRAHWEERYARWPDAFVGDPVPEIARLRPLLRPGARVLSLADGQGRNSVPLARAGFDVTAVELIASASSRAAQTAQAEGLSLHAVCADVVAWLETAEAQGPWDAVVSVFGFLGEAADRRVASVLQDRLAPDALVLVVGSTRTSSPTTVAADWASLVWTHQVDGDRFWSLGRR